MASASKACEHQSTVPAAHITTVSFSCSTLQGPITCISVSGALPFAGALVSGSSCACWSASPRSSTLPGPKMVRSEAQCRQVPVRSHDTGRGCLFQDRSGLSGGMGRVGPEEFLEPDGNTNAGGKGSGRSSSTAPRSNTASLPSIRAPRPRGARAGWD